MGRNIVYIFDKKNFVGSILGEIQDDFNMCFTIDGTKDSFSLIVHSFNGDEVEPYTILWHPKTGTAWCVTHDKVERYQNDSGYYYIHNLECNGASELLNARELTDCGFNDKTYSIRNFIIRLFNLSNIERDLIPNVYAPSDFDINKKVEFIKTFENYTLLSALREFLDSYNMSFRLDFTLYTSQPPLTINGAKLQLIPKTGDRSLTQHNISEFEDVREVKTLDKNSFGSCVVSNAENVVSSISKTFPTTCGAIPTGTEYIVKAENAVIRLPSKVFKGNWLKMINTTASFDAFVIHDGVASQISVDNQRLSNLNVYDESSVERVFDELYTYILNNYSQELANGFANALEDEREEVIRKIKAANTITLYDGVKVKPVSNTSQDFVKPDNIPYIAKFNFFSHADNDEYLIFCDKDTKNCLYKKWQGICWERGSNVISGFDAFEPETGRQAVITLKNLLYTDLQEDYEQMDFSDTQGQNEMYTYFSYELNGYEVRLTTAMWRRNNYYFYPRGNDITGGFTGNTMWIVNYIPMSDLKIKVDNTRDRNDIQLYNQNGKMTDSVALSKLINSYSQEISSDNITRYMQYYDFNSVPKVGSFVVKDNDLYVVNNVSLTFTQNEFSPDDDYEEQYEDSFGYFIDCEINMSKYCATKSLMVNPNTNIRDYGIPQNYNVKRKQLYRDFYELNYSYNDDTQNSVYMHPITFFRFLHYPNEIQNLISLIKVGYSNELNGSNYWYFQLETTTYVLDKMIYIVLDFNDNNIIGYANQNVWAGFVISRIFSGSSNTANVPISYVDEYGTFESIDLLFLNNAELTGTYRNYLDDNDDVSNYSNFINSGIPFANYSVFIPSSIWENAYSSGDYTMEIYEEFYYKDAIEVPVFEYVTQIDDTEDVLIGDNIMKQYEGTSIIYLYSFVKGTNLNQNNVSPTHHVERVNAPVIQRGFRIRNSAYFGYGSSGTAGLWTLYVKLYDEIRWVVREQEWVDGMEITPDADYDYAIFRHAYDTEKQEEVGVDLMFIAKKVPVLSITSSGIRIRFNHYKLN